MSIKSFGIAVDESVDYQEARTPIGEPVEISGRQVTLYTPTPGQAAYLAMTLAQFEQGDSLAGIGQIINLIGNCMDEEGQQHWRKSLVDPRAGLDVDDFIDLATYILEEGGGNPTPAPSGSSRSRSGTGRSSTATSRPRASRRSTSPSTGS